MSCLERPPAIMTTHRGTWKIGRPTAPAGARATGKIIRLFVGQTYGFIVLPNGDEVFFHRADLKDQAAFNTLQIGDAVAFELIDDRVSGKRAIHVVRAK